MSLALELGHSDPHERFAGRIAREGLGDFHSLQQPPRIHATVNTGITGT
jgi:hypothetical protein